MKKTKLRRALILTALFSSVIFGVWIITSTLNQSLMFFYTPTELLENTTVTKELKIGGVVKANSVKKNIDNDKFLITFTLTDCSNEVEVHYNGLLPSLFREEQAIIAVGKMDGDYFSASKLLAKHDENYVPKELKDTLPKNSPCNPKNFKP